MRRDNASRNAGSAPRLRTPLSARSGAGACRPEPVSAARQVFLHRRGRLRYYAPVRTTYPALHAGSRRSAAVQALGALATLIDRINGAIGKAAAWLALVMVLVQFALVILRYVFGIGSVPLQESLLYAHAALFMLAAGYTLLAGGHVRVDIFYREAS